MITSATRAWKLLFRSPLHISEQGVGLEETLEHIPSDSLFSALVVTWLEMVQYRDLVPKLLQALAINPPLLLTSAFPFAGDVLFLPKPQLALTPNGAESGKKYKKVRWVSVAIFEKLIAGIDPSSLDALWAEFMPAKKDGDQEDKVKLQNGTVWVTKEEKERLKAIVELDEEDSLNLWSEQNTPKVTIDRIANASALFHVGRLHFAPGCGLWCMARGEEEWLNHTQAALRLLADSGIGGQRSRGNGQFCLVKIDTPSLAIHPQIPSQASAYNLLLSRLAPRKEELELLRKKHANYQLVTVGGFNGTPGDKPVVRKQVRMLTEGSIIGNTARIVGHLVDVTPDSVGVGHPIYRNGFGFTLPIHLHNAEGQL